MKYSEENPWFSLPVEVETHTIPSYSSVSGVSRKIPELGARKSFVLPLEARIYGTTVQSSKQSFFFCLCGRFMSIKPLPSTGEGPDLEVPPEHYFSRMDVRPFSKTWFYLYGPHSCFNSIPCHRMMTSQSSSNSQRLGPTESTHTQTGLASFIVCVFNPCLLD